MQKANQKQLIFQSRFDQIHQAVQQELMALLNPRRIAVANDQSVIRQGKCSSAVVSEKRN